MILYEGPSMLDGAPIVAIATTGKSANRKTGDMIQTWILRQEWSPVDAVRYGADSSICGSCTHRGAPAEGKPRTCYVNVGQAPQGIWRAWKAGRYPKDPRAPSIWIEAHGTSKRFVSDPLELPDMLTSTMPTRRRATTRTTP